MTEQQTQQPEVKKNDFVLRVVVIAAASIAVLFFVKLWIIDPVMAAHEAGGMQEEKEHPPGTGLNAQSREPEKNWSKFKNKTTYQEAGKFLGQYVEIEALVVSSYNNGNICYLNFNKNYREFLSLVIFADNYKRFPDNPEKYYLNKLVRIEGRVKDYKGRLEIVLGSKEQITVVE